MATAAPVSPHLRLSEGEKNLVEALAGALGAVCGTWVFYPLDTLKTRLQAAVAQPPGAPPDSLASICRQLVRRAGARGCAACAAAQTAERGR
jgi:hypothetical protein